MKPKNTTNSGVPEELNAVIQASGLQFDLDGSSRFARQIELIGLAGHAFELSNELTEVQHAPPSLESPSAGADMGRLVRCVGETRMD